MFRAHPELGARPEFIEGLEMNVARGALFLLTIAGICSASGVRQIGNPWPSIAPIAKTFHFADAGSASVELTIQGVNGRPLYLLKCHPGYYEDPSFDYTGAFDCQMQVVDLKWKAFRSHTLLFSELNKWTAWDSPGRFLIEDLRGECAHYPDWGTERRLKLRGMEIILALDNIQLADGDQALKSFDFSVDVKPSSDAISAVSAPAAFEEPKFSNGTMVCGKLLPHHMPGTISQQYVREHGLGPPYIQIRDASKTAAFPVAAGVNTKLVLPVLDVNGHQAYTLECVGSFGEAGTAQWGIRCQFFAKGNSLNLLGDSVDPYTLNYRGLFEAEQLTPACREYPEWGAHRQFRLRNLDITLVALGDLAADNAFQEDSSKQIVLQTEVKPDSSATSPVALPSEYVDWRLLDKLSDCDEILIHKTMAIK